MTNPPLSLRDYLAYAMTGVFLVTAALLAWRGNLNIRLTPTWHLVIAVPGVYAIGHAVAELTNLVAPTRVNLLRRDVIGMLLRDATPEERQATRLTVRPLPEVLRRNVIEAARLSGVEGSFTDGTPAAAERGEALADLARTRTLMTDTRIYDLLDRWSMLREFARNVGVSLAISAAVLIAGAIAHRSIAIGAAALLAASVAAVFRERYLNYQRVFWSRMFVAFANTTSAGR